MEPRAANLAGTFIVFDGPDGSGKTTQFRRFGAHCHAAGLTVCAVREPGGTAIGERIRDVLLDPAHPEMGVRSETMLYMASRAQLVEEIIRPARQRGEVILADRFISSTLAYQGAAGGLTAEEIMAVGAVAIGDCRPDLVVIFDVDEATASRRLGGTTRRGADQPSLFADRMERKQLEYRQRVRAGYLEQARTAPPGAYLVIDGSADEDGVFTALIEGITGRFGAPAPADS